MTFLKPLLFSEPSFDVFGILSLSVAGILSPVARRAPSAAFDLYMLQIWALFRAVLKGTR